MKKLLFILLIFCTSQIAYSQILRNVSLNLNAGGEVFDVVYIPNLNKYLIVGSFDSINGIAHQKHAFLNENCTVDNSLDLGITYLSGNFYTCENYNNSILIGGDFDQINSTTRLGLVRYSIGTAGFTLAAWQPFSALAVIYDIVKTTNGNFCAAGKFPYFNTNNVFDVFGNQHTRKHIMEFSHVGQMTSNFSTSTAWLTGSNLSSPYFPKLIFDKINNEYLLFARFIHNTNGNSPQEFIGFSMDNTGALITYYKNGAGGSSNHGDYYQILNDSTFIGNQWIGGNGVIKAVGVNRNVITSIGGSTNSGCGMALTADNFGNLVYNNKVHQLIYDASPDLLSLVKSDYTINIGSGGFVNLGLNEINCQTINGGNSSGYYNFNSNNTNSLIHSRDKLFISEESITGSGTNLSTGLTVFCLEPEDPKVFLTNQFIDEVDQNGLLTGADGYHNPDSVVCPGQRKLYRITPSEGAEAYIWKYTGTGLKYSFSQPFAGADETFYTDLVDSVISPNTGGNSIWIYVKDGFTLGELSVTPFSTCNTATDYLFAKPLSLNYSNLPLPNVQITDSMHFTCVNNTIQATANSSTPGVSYSWVGPNNLSVNGANFSVTGSSDPNNPSTAVVGNYIVTVKENSTGCLSKDTMIVSDKFDTETATITTNPTEFNCNTTSFQIIGGGAPNSTIQWELDSNQGVFLPNPLTINDTLEKNFKLYTTHNNSGCVTNINFDLENYINLDEIEGVLSNYPQYPTTSIVVDTISCANNTLSVICVPDPNNAFSGTSTSSWVVNNALIGNALNLSIADSAGMSNNAKVYQFITQHGGTGCIDTNDVVFVFDLEEPDANIYLGPSTTNCSYDTLTLSHIPTLGNMTQGWLNGTTNTLSLDTLVQGFGTFVFEVIDNDNGCVDYDTTFVVKDLEMVLLATPDTTVCTSESFTLSVQPVNVAESIDYVWSNGVTGSTTNGIGGVDTMFTVTGTSVSGCLGYDTILVHVNEPITADFTPFTECGSPGGSIQVSNVNGGAGDYRYSLTPSNFTTNTSFDSLVFGTYTIYIEDSLGCIYNFSTTLDATAQTPEMDFLLQTYNAVNDTVVAVNITTNTSFDSIAWYLPSGFPLISANDSVLVFQVADTGQFLITLVGYQDTCEFEYTKPIYVGEFNPDGNQTVDTLGIKSFVMSPNPTNGNFTVDAEFGIAQNYSVLVFDNTGQLVVGVGASGFGKSISLPLSLSNEAIGTYFVWLIGEYDSQSKSLVKN